MIGRKTILTDQQIQEILWFYDKGATIASLQEKYQSSKIREIVKAHGILRENPIKKKKEKELFMPDPIEGRICKGMSYSDYLRKAGYKN